MNKPVALATLAITTWALASCDQPPSTAQVKKVQKVPVAQVFVQAPSAYVAPVAEVTYAPPQVKPVESVVPDEDIKQKVEKELSSFHDLEPIGEGVKRYACAPAAGEPVDRYYTFNKSGSGSLKLLTTSYVCQMRFNWTTKDGAPDGTSITSELTSNNGNCVFHAPPKVTLTEDPATNMTVLHDRLDNQTMYCSVEEK